MSLPTPLQQRRMHLPLAGGTMAPPAGYEKIRQNPRALWNILASLVLFLGTLVLADMRMAFFILMVVVFTSCMVFAFISFHEALFLFAFAIPIEQGFFLYAGARYNSLSYLVLLMVAVWVLRFGRTIRGAGLSDLEKIVAAWILWSGISLLWSRNLMVGSGILWCNLGGLVILYGFSRGFRNLRQILQCMWYYIGGAVFIISVLMPLYKMGAAYVRVGNRYIPSAIGLGYGFAPHDISRTASVAMICALCLWQFDPSKSRRKVALILALIFGVIVPLTLSRGTLISQAVAILAWVMLRSGQKKWRDQIKKLVMTTVLIASVAGLVGYINRDAVMERVDQTRSEYEVGNMQQMTTGRSRIWTAGLHFFLENPVLGLGLGSFPIMYSLRAGDIVRAAHNEYVKIAAELGLPGFMLLCIWIFGYGWKSWRLKSLRHVTFAWWIVFALVIGTHDLGRGKDFWMTLGFIAALTQLERDLALRSRTAAQAAAVVRPNPS
jgi:O-antigen ligase